MTLERAFKQNMARLERDGKRLVRRGWIVPMNLTFIELSDLIEASKSTSPDDLFIGLYEHNGGKEFERAIDDLLHERSLNTWSPLIRQTADAYRRKHYAITVPALLALIEASAMHSQGNVGFLTYARQCVDTAEARLPDSLSVVLWRITWHYLVLLWGGPRFGGAKPVGLNRNWILHGRTAANWTQADSLRLFQAAHTVSALLR